MKVLVLGATGGTGRRIVRADVTNFVVDPLTDDRWVLQMPLLTGSP
jgi:hypothetical protein